MEWARVVAVTGPGGPGSGYVVAPRLVLTSAHVVRAPGEPVTVFRPGRAGQFAGRVRWCGTPGGRDDAALVEVDDAAWTPPPGVVAFGHTVTHRTGIPCVTWGSPELVQRAGRPAEVAQVSGTFNAGDRMVGDRYVLNLDPHPPEATGPGTSPWGGLSGAAMCCGELVTGVIATDPAGRGHSALEAVPMYVLLRDPAFAALLGSVSSEAIELRELADPQARARTGGAITSPAGLLPARRAVVPFRGREELLGDLRDWAESPGPGLWLLHGPGGQGKTRLVHEFAARLGRTTLWLDSAASDLGVLADTVVPLLVVVDYAETRVEQVNALLDVVTRRRSPTPVKIIALARTAGSWWQRLASGNDLAGDLVDVAPVRELPVLDATASGQEDMYRAAVDAFAAALTPAPNFGGVDWTSAAAECSPPATSADETVLSVQMTALSDLLDAASPDATTSPRGPEDRLLDHERRYWENTARAHGLLPGLSLATLTDAITAAALIGPPRHEDADKFLSLIPGLADQPLDRRDTVRAWLADLYPSDGETAFAYLQPDRLAERLVGRLILDRSRLLDSLAPGLRAAEAADLLTVCVRAAAHRVFADAVATWLTAFCLRHAETLAVPAIGVATRVEAPAPLVTALDRLAGDPGAKLSWLSRLDAALPGQSHVLADLKVYLGQRIVTRRRESQESDGDRARLAAALTDLANRLSVVGRGEEGLTAITEAVRIQRKLAEERPGDHLPGLARSLLALSNRQAEAGNPEAGFASITESVEIRRRLSQRPGALLSDLAAGLTTLSNRQADIGQPEQALESVAEAVRIRRKLAEQQPGTHLPSLSVSLHNLANRQAALGQLEEALTTSTEAIDIQRELATTGPDAHLPGLAASLTMLSNHQADLGHSEDALASVAEAVRTRRKLAAERPVAYLPDLGRSLNNLANRQAALGQWEEALASATEAVHIQRELANAKPDVSLPDLARYLTTLSTSQSDLGRREEALEAVAEAVRIRRKLARERPDVHLPGLSLSLNNLANRQADLGQREEALVTATEAVHIRRRLAGQRPDTHLPDLSLSLHNLANRQAKLGHHDDALASATEAVHIWRKLAGQRPDAHLPNLALSLGGLANRQANLGHHEEALATITEVVRIQRELAGQRPDTHLPGLAAYLHNLSGCQADVGRWEDALGSISEAVQIRQELVAQRPVPYLPDLAGSLARLANRHAALGDHDEAVSAAAEAVRIQRDLAANRADLLLPDLATNLHSLSNHQAALRLYDEALASVSEAVEIRRALAAKHPARYRPGLASSLHNLALSHHDLGQRERALATIAEVMELYRALPGAESDLARALRLQKRWQLPPG
ncbi:tetratricopeptide repeat protein [Amycolatopsis samaneae]|uniref:Tetratricopeptide repeat protein n=1 Tax=Amycolatopsis samaneae TaxID=664691 RepID=A0ABW5GIP1_9PSEU